MNNKKGEVFYVKKFFGGLCIYHGLMLAAACLRAGG